MTTPAQHRALQLHRQRMAAKGMARFEVRGLETDRDLMRTLARRLAEGGPDSERIRATVRDTLVGESARTGGVLAALRRSPLVGIDLDIPRAHETGRPVDL